MLNVIPIKVIKNGEKYSKIPHKELIEQATGQTGWKMFQERKITPKELDVFKQANYLATITGKINNLTVIDLDGTAEHDLINEGYELPKTPTIKTISNGKHLYFQYTDKVKQGQKLGKHQNIDVRNNGGYAVSEGEGYEWELTFDDVDPQPIPNWLVEYINNAQKQPKLNDKPKQTPKPLESLTNAYSKARNVNMIDFLQHHGYEVEEGQKFSCIFDEHPDENPSAEILTNNKGEHRYICWTHEGTGHINLSLVDLWTELKNIDVPTAVNNILHFVGEHFEESEFIKSQKEKYHYNTFKLNDLQDIKQEYPNLYKYLHRYELEVRALMDYAESNLHGTLYSHNGQAIFYISKEYAGEMFRRYKHRSTANSTRAKQFLYIMCLLGLMERVSISDLTEEVRKRTNKLQQNGRHINFYSFNRFNDLNLSIANNRAKQLQDSNFKINSMSKDILISIFGREFADKVFPDQRNLSATYYNYLRLYTRIIRNHIDLRGWTTRKEVIEDLPLETSKRNKEYHFDKVIHEICEANNLEFKMANKDIRERFGIKGKGRKKLLYQGS